jgi:Fe-S-cluster containining protein
LEDFYGRYARKIQNRWSLTENVISGKYDCVFLDRGSGKATCSLYEARPSQCRTWPFWSENLTSEAAWQQAKNETPCPGMDTGKLISANEIRIIRDAE